MLPRLCEFEIGLLLLLRGTHTGTPPHNHPQRHKKYFAIFPLHVFGLNGYRSDCSGSRWWQLLIIFISLLLVHQSFAIFAVMKFGRRITVRIPFRRPHLVQTRLWCRRASTMNGSHSISITTSSSGSSRFLTFHSVVSFFPNHPTSV